MGVRLHGLDLLRGTAMVLGVVLHTAVPYTRWDIPWLYRVTTSNPAYDLLLVAIHSFRMPLFFLLAGFFAHLQQQRLGPTPFLRQRLIRIGLPFAAGMVTLVPAMSFMVLRDTADLDAFRRAHHIPIPADETASIPITGLPTFHLWFLEVVLLFCVLGWGWTTLSGGRALCPQRVDRILGWGLRSIWPVAFLAGSSVIWFQGSSPGDGVSFLQYSTVTPGVRILGFSFSFFAMGWWLYRNTSAVTDLGVRWRPMLAVGAASLVVLLGLRLQMFRNGMQAGWIEDVVGLAAEGMAAWFLSLGLFAWGLQALPEPSRWTRQFVDSSYWIYLIHLPLVFGIQLAIRNWPIPIAAKFLVCLGVSIGIGLVTYNVFVRTTWVGWVLNGHRISRPPQTFSKILPNA